jgi:hypothetical protein
MNAVPLTLAQANEFIEKNHRHHHKVPRDKFRVGCEVGGKLVGVATVGQPLARLLCDGFTLEVTRLCTDGTKGVCSFLYSRCARIAKEMGYHKIITYILESEDGTSLKASGWHCEVEKCGGGSWNVPSRPREVVVTTLFGEVQKYPIGKKQRWAKEL